MLLTDINFAEIGAEMTELWPIFYNFNYPDCRIVETLFVLTLFSIYIYIILVFFLFSLPS